MPFRTRTVRRTEKTGEMTCDRCLREDPHGGNDFELSHTFGCVTPLDGVRVTAAICDACLLSIILAMVPNADIRDEDGNRVDAELLRSVDASEQGRARAAAAAPGMPTAREADAGQPRAKALADELTEDLVESAATTPASAKVAKELQKEARAFLAGLLEAGRSEATVRRHAGYLRCLAAEFDREIDRGHRTRGYEPRATMLTLIDLNTTERSGPASRDIAGSRVGEFNTTCGLFHRFLKSRR